MTITEKDIADVMERVPDLGDNGFACSYTPDPGRGYLLKSADSVELCAWWINAAVWTRTAASGRAPGSYGLKHRVEDWAAKYVTNGAFLTAAYITGVPIKRWRDSPNASIGISLVWLRHFEAGRYGLTLPDGKVHFADGRTGESGVR